MTTFAWFWRLLDGAFVKCQKYIYLFYTNNVNLQLLTKILKIIGLPGDVVELIRVWLREQFYYFDLNGNNLFKSYTGTIQGSILGPFLYAIYVSPIFDICNMSNFATDNFVMSQSKDKSTLALDLTRKLEAITERMPLRF